MINFLTRNQLVILKILDRLNAPETKLDDVERRANLVMALPGGMDNRLNLLRTQQLDFCIVQLALVLVVESFERLDRG